MRRKKITEFLKFILVGISNTAVAYIVYGIVYYLIFQSVHLANFFAFIFSVLNAYFFQKKYVFKDLEKDNKQPWWKILWKMYVSYAFTGLILTELLLILWFEVIHLENYVGFIVDILSGININTSNQSIAVLIAPAIDSILIIPISFLLNKYWAFGNKKADSAN